MANPKVFHLTNPTPENLKKLWEQSGLAACFHPADFIALKIHFGEPGNTSYLKPHHVWPIVEALKTKCQNYFLTDANTIYLGKRADAVNHLRTAFAHGYDFAPVVIADGLLGHDFEKLKVDFPHFKEVKIGAAIAQANSILTVTHFKGHDVCVFGGALKNLGMGSGCRAAKQQMHSDMKPVVKTDQCTGCAECEKWCPTEAAKMQPATNKSYISPEKCIGCGECVAACRFGAIAINWAGSPESVQEKFVEHAGALIKQKPGKIGYINYLLEISPSCDCYGHSDAPIVPDLGVVASTDPVAIDQACYDLVNKAAGKNIFKTLYPEVNGEVQLAHAEKLGLGSRMYELVEII